MCFHKHVQTIGAVLKCNNESSRDSGLEEKLNFNEPNPKAGPVHII